MGMLCVEKATGRFLEWVRHGQPSVYDAAQHDLMDADSPPAENTRWNGTAWVPLPPKTDAEKDTDLQAFLDSAGGRVIKALALAAIDKGVITLADIRAKYRTLP